MAKPKKRPAKAPAAKRKSPPKKTTRARDVAAVATVLVLRTVSADLVSRNGFIWPEAGPVACSDWSPRPVCGCGLHGLLWGAGDGNLLDWSESAKWQVVEVPAAELVELDGGKKVKFPRGVVLFCGDRKGATELVAARAPAGTPITGGTATAGYRGTATAGYGGSISILYWDSARSLYRKRCAEVDGETIKPNIKYRLDDKGAFVVVEASK